MRPLTRREYVLDVAAETECRDTSYTFWCRRVVWSQPLKFDNELYVTVHYNQVGPPRQAPLGPPPCHPPQHPPSLSHVPVFRPLQVLPDYLKGLFTVLPPARPGEQHFPHVAKLAALQHRAKDRHHVPTAYGPGQGDWGGSRPMGCKTHWPSLALTSISLQAGGAGLRPPPAFPPAEGTVLAPHGDAAHAASPGAQRPPGQGTVPG